MARCSRCLYIAVQHHTVLVVSPGCCRMISLLLADRAKLSWLTLVHSQPGRQCCRGAGAAAAAALLTCSLMNAFFSFMSDLKCCCSCLRNAFSEVVCTHIHTVAAQVRTEHKLRLQLISVLLQGSPTGHIHGCTCTTLQAKPNSNAQISNSRSAEQLQEVPDAFDSLACCWHWH